MNRDKIRTMVRSILPSTSRGVQRDKALLKRELRRGVRQDLRNEDFEESAVDFRRDVSMKWIVIHRRSADKLNHFMRWCEALTEGMSREEALSFVKSLLPRNLIGDHAYSHWEQHMRPRTFIVTGSYRSRAKRRRQSAIDSMVFRLHRALAEDPTLTGRLNAEIKKAKLEGQPRRMLFGVHDVPNFVRDICEPDWGMERRVTLRLIEQIEGGREAAFDVLAASHLEQHFAGGLPSRCFVDAVPNSFAPRSTPRDRPPSPA
jgi:hypothetical protein